MHTEPLQELRLVRLHIEHACAEQGQTYADYIAQAQGKYTDRLVRRRPRPRLGAREASVEPEMSGKA